MQHLGLDSDDSDSYDFILLEAVTSVCQTLPQFVQKPKKTRAPKSIYNTDNQWSRMLNNESIADPKSSEGRKFRRRFRVPYALFKDIVGMAKEEQWMPQKEADACGRKAVPLEMKVLAVLRVLGRGVCFDEVAEILTCSEEILRVFFHDFVKKFVTKCYDRYVKPPLSRDEIRKAMDEYTMVGLPGCIGSTDCVHIHWDNCPAQKLNLYKGKNGYPTLSYEVSVGPDIPNSPGGRFPCPEAPHRNCQMLSEPISKIDTALCCAHIPKQRF